jgi:hypothetical protein
MKKIFAVQTWVSTLLLFIIGVFTFYLSAQDPSSISAVCGLGGRCEVFVSRAGNQGALYHTWQLEGNIGNWQKPWMSYSPAPDDNLHGLVSGKDKDGRIMAAWISGGEIYIASARAKDVSLSTYKVSAFGPPKDPQGKDAKFKYLTLANNAEGFIDIFALDEGGHALCFEQTKQSDPVALQWSWIIVYVGGGALKNISASTFGSDKKMGLVATGGNDVVYMTQQSAPAGSWDQWVNLGGHDIKEAHAQESMAGQFEITALGSDGKIYLNFQNVGTNAWSGWSALIFDRSGRSEISFSPNIFFDHWKDGTLFLVFHTETFNQINRFAISQQYAGNAGWANSYRTFSNQDNISKENGTGYFVPTLTAIALGQDGNLNIFGFKGGGKVAHFTHNPASASDAFGHALIFSSDNSFGSIPFLPW